MKLFYREVGETGQPIVILHGLFGSSDNWFTQAKMLADNHKVYLIDQRNHGQSPHSDEFNYDTLADDLREFLVSNNILNPILIGHSLGGKTAMKFATTNPESLSKLIVVDIAPKTYPVKHDGILEGLKALPIDSIKSRNEADQLLAEYVEEPNVRQFLLKNLQRTPEGGFTWKINIPVLDQNIESVGEGIIGLKKFDKPTLFIRGLHSDYIEDADMGYIKTIFPQANLVTLETGHWVQAERPVEFVEVVNKFLAA
ncbi:MAG TPA: alpha/beta fold hydrolase [Cyclobacteriaceae bacterium]|nr:alpha/beta fold hydrolase [Cyclobacteriaceae bacterium]